MSLDAPLQSPKDVPDILKTDGPVKILCVDDEPSILSVMRRGLEDQFIVFTALSAEKGMEILKAHPDVAVILSDQKMEGMSGSDFLAASQTLIPDAMRIIVSAYSEFELMIDAINKGNVYKFVLKPFELETLQITVKRAAEHYHHKKAFEKAYHELQDAQRHLIRSEKMSVLGQLTSSVAHELGNPISNINQASTLAQHEWSHLKTLFEKTMKAGSFDDLQKITEWIHQNNLAFTVSEFDSILQTIKNSTEMVKVIIQDLRGFARLDDKAWTDVNVHDQIERAINLLRSKYKYHVRFHRQFGQIPSIHGLAGPLTQVMLNLIQNAAQSIAEQGDIWITTLQEGERIKISIKDNGRGIAQENLPRIFESGFTTKSEDEGTGLGLTISYGIIEKHAGTITVESTLNKGTEFIITLPIVHGS